MLEINLFPLTPQPLWLRLLPTFLRQRVEQDPTLVKGFPNIGWLVADKLLRMVIGLLVGVWVARYLGPEQFGLINYASAIVGIFVAIAGMGLDGIVVRDLVNTPREAPHIMGTAFMLQLSGGLLAFVLAVGAVYVVRPNDVMAMAAVAILGASLLFKAADVVRYWFESQVRSKYVVWLECGVFLVFAAVKVGLILMQASLLTFIWTILLESVLVALGLLLLYQLRNEHLYRWHASANFAKVLIKESWPLILSGLTIIIYMRIDQVMLGEMINDEAVGIYSAAVRISEIWYFIPLAIVSTLYPALIEIRKKNEAIYLQRLGKLFSLLIALSLIVAVLFALSAQPLIVLLYGKAYQEASSALVMLGLTGLFVSLGVASSKWYLLEGLAHLMLLRTLCGAVINVLLNLWLIPECGIQGAAIATLVSYSVTAFWFDWFSAKTRPIFYLKVRSFLMVDKFKSI